MKIVTIKYGITKNEGDYNSTRLDAEMELGEKDCPMDAMDKLKTFINTGGYPENKPAVVPAEKTTTEKKVDTDIVLPETPVKTPAEKKPAQKTTKKAAKKATKKVTPKANIVYSREQKVHKDEMSKILSQEFPNWKTELLDQAKALSGKLVGTDIYNFKGELLESFTQAIIEGMTADSSDL